LYFFWLVRKAETLSPLLFSSLGFSLWTFLSQPSILIWMGHAAYLLSSTVFFVRYFRASRHDRVRKWLENCLKLLYPISLLCPAYYLLVASLFFVHHFRQKWYRPVEMHHPVEKWLKRWPRGSLCLKEFRFSANGVVRQDLVPGIISALHPFFLQRLYLQRVELTSSLSALLCSMIGQAPRLHVLSFTCCIIPSPEQLVPVLKSLESCLCMELRVSLKSNVVSSALSAYDDGEWEPSSDILCALRDLYVHRSKFGWATTFHVPIHLGIKYFSVPGLSGLHLGPPLRASRSHHGHLRAELLSVFLANQSCLVSLKLPYTLPEGFGFGHDIFRCIFAMSGLTRLVDNHIKDCKEFCTMLCDTQVKHEMKLTVLKSDCFDLTPFLRRQPNLVSVCLLPQEMPSDLIHSFSALTSLSFIHLSFSSYDWAIQHIVPLRINLCICKVHSRYFAKRFENRTILQKIHNHGACVLAPGLTRLTRWTNDDNSPFSRSGDSMEVGFFLDSYKPNVRRLCLICTRLAGSCAC